MIQARDKWSYSYDGQMKRKPYKREAKWYGYGEERMTYSEYSNEGFVEHKVKHRVYCPQSLKCKLRFDEERQAENFIRYNRAEIIITRGYAPVRVYYCTSCAGWHVTSRVYRTRPSGRDNNRIFENKNNSSLS